MGGCVAAAASFHETYAAEAGFTTRVGEALRDAARACRGASTAASPTCLAPTLQGCGDKPIPGTLWLALPRVPAMACGWGAEQTRTVEDTPLGGYVMVMATGTSIRDVGPATVTYTPTTDAATYGITGTVWGFAASGVGVATQPGIITVAGVPIEADTWAAAGCGEGSDKLCWAQGNAMTSIPGFVVYLESNFYLC